MSSVRDPREKYHQVTVRPFRKGGRTLGFALAKGLIRGLTRRPTRPHDLSVLPIFGCIQGSPWCRLLGTLRHMTPGDGRSGGVSLRNESAPCSGIS